MIIHQTENPGGWMPPEERTNEQQSMSDEFRTAIGSFKEVGEAVELPERALFHEMEIKHTGALLKRPWQVTGSCVGVGGMRSYSNAALGDAVYRGDHEIVNLQFPFSTYGVGRKLAGMRGKGSGSFGGAQSKAVQQYGINAIDHPKVPQPRIRGQWAQWTKSQELAWSHSSYWSVDYDEMYQDAIKQSITDVVRVDDTEELKQLLAQGYGVTLASSFGTRPRVRDGVLLGPWNGSWAHQMSCGGMWNHPRLGWIFVIDNQWGHAHGSCPELSKLGVEGSFWITEDTFASIIKRGEVFGHSATKGFPKKPIPWNEFAWKIEF